MRSQSSLRATMALLLGLSLASACTDDDESATPLGDGGVDDAGGLDSGLGDAGLSDGSLGGPDATDTPDAHRADSGLPTCSELDRPDELARPPSGALPCELLPPGFAR